MERKDSPEIVSVERLRDGVAVKFADGRCVFYSAGLLYATMDKAKLMDEAAVAW